MKKQNKNVTFTIVFTALLFIATILISELAIALLLNSASVLEGGLLISLRSYYMEKDRNIIQFMADCAIHDIELSYILKTGKCHIKNREFDVDYSINSAGLRDDEASLISPEVVVLGDSHAMGWGVSQGLMFSSLLEKTLRKSVLNAAISSYGTARELKMLERINTNNLRYLIIQYCDNDFGENRLYATEDGKLSIMTEEKYNLVRENHKNDVAYYFGKHSLNLISLLLKNLTESSGATNFVSKANDLTLEEVNVFLNPILNSPIDLSDVVIIVIEVNGSAINDSLFINKLREKTLEYPSHSTVKNIQTIDLSSILGKDRYFRLDDHISSFGHHAIAEALAQLIKEHQMTHQIE